MTCANALLLLTLCDCKHKITLRCQVVVQFRRTKQARQ